MAATAMIRIISTLVPAIGVAPFPTDVVNSGVSKPLGEFEGCRDGSIEGVDNDGNMEGDCDGVCVVGDVVGELDGMDVGIDVLGNKVGDVEGVATVGDTLGETEGRLEVGNCDGDVEVGACVVRLGANVVVDGIRG
jgi:hypothetical protein